MEILEKGPGWSIERKCTGFGLGDGGCGSRLLIQEYDIYTKESCDYDGSGSIVYYYVFQCPVCGKETTIPSCDLPGSIKKNAIKRKKYNYKRIRRNHERNI